MKPEMPDAGNAASLMLIVSQPPKDGITPDRKDLQLHHINHDNTKN